MLARTLWPDIPEGRLRSYLRSVLWRLARCCPGTVEVSASELRLASHVTVDLWQSTAVAWQLFDRSAAMSGEQLSHAMRVDLREDLLPAWLDDDWLTADRERFRQLRLHSLEILCERLTAAGWHGAAVDSGLSAASADPFRESARRALIKAHCAEGNFHLAVSEFNAYSQLLRSELRCEPSQELRELATPASQEMATGDEVAGPGVMPPCGSPFESWSRGASPGRRHLHLTTERELRAGASGPE
ncbi:MAG: AfsR/SARP family transcriptional regulator [Streptosporangiaceae bacterium]